MNTAKPYKVIEPGRRTVSATTFRQAQIAVAKRIGADASGRVLTIAGPDRTVEARNNGLTISYVDR